MQNPYLMGQRRRASRPVIKLTDRFARTLIGRAQLAPFDCERDVARPPEERGR